MDDKKKENKKKRRVSVAAYNGVYATGSSARVAKDNAKKGSNYKENITSLYDREAREAKAVIDKTRNAKKNKHKLTEKYSDYITES